MNKIEKARKVMRDAFEDDEGFKECYVANIAMLLQDRYGITEHEKRNNAGRDIIELMFYK